MQPRPRYTPSKSFGSLVTFILQQCAIGAALAIAAAGALVFTNAGGLWSLISGSADPLTSSAMLAVGFAALFGAIYAGSASMQIPCGH